MGIGDDKNLTDRILACAAAVHKTLGPGFLEKIYENALLLEMRQDGLRAEQQKSFCVYYRNTVVEDFTADLIIEGKVILELKAQATFAPIHLATCLNYLRATQLPICLLLNFGQTKLQIKRLVGETYMNLK